MAELSAKKAKKDKKKEKQILENGGGAAETLSPQQDTPVKKKSKVNGHTVLDSPAVPTLSARKDKKDQAQQLLDSDESVLDTPVVVSSPSLQQLKNERKEKQREKQEKKKQKKEERAALRSENQLSTTSVVRTARKRMLVSCYFLQVCCTGIFSMFGFTLVERVRYSTSMFLYGMVCGIFICFIGRLVRKFFVK